MTFMRRSQQSREYSARSMSENMRDLDQALRRGVPWNVRDVTAFYTEPMWLGGLRAQPISIVLGRIQSENAPEVPVTCGSLVHFVWDGPEQGARITKIDGLTVSTATQYRFVFLIAEGDV